MTTASVGRGLVARMFSPRNDYTPRTAAEWFADWIGGSKSLSGEVVNSKTALGISAYFACLRAISEDIGKLPRFTYKRLQPRGRERAPQHPTYRLVHSEPNPEMSAMAFHETLTSHALGWKGGFAEIVRDGGGNPVALWPLDPCHVEQVRERGSRRQAYKITHPDMPPVILPPERVLHLHGLGYDGITGYILSCIAKEALGGAIAVAKHGAAFFGNGATQSGVLKIPGTLSKPALDNLRNSWADRYAGTENSHKPVILEQGLEWESTSTDPQKSQMIESMEFSVEDVARWFRVPPNKIGHFKRAQGWSTVEMLNIDYVVDTLTPWLARWEQEYNRKLLRPAERDTFYIEHEVKGLMRGDAAARVAFYRGMFDMGAMSPNDIREDENLNPVPDGDKYMVQMNLQTLDQASDGKSIKGEYYRKALQHGWLTIADVRKLEGMPNVEGGDTVFVPTFWQTMDVAQAGGVNAFANQTNDNDTSGDETDAPVAMRAFKPKALPTNRISTLIRLKDSNEPMLVDALHRVLKFEAAKVQKASKSGDFDKLASDWRADQQIHVTAAIAPVIDAFVDAAMVHLTGETASEAVREQVFSTTKDYAARHVDSSVASMRGAVDDWTNGQRASAAAKDHMAMLVELVMGISGAGNE